MAAQVSSQQTLDYRCEGKFSTASEGGAFTQKGFCCCFRPLFRIHDVGLLRKTNDLGKLNSCEEGERELLESKGLSNREKEEGRKAESGFMLRVLIHP